LSASSWLTAKWAVELSVLHDIGYVNDDLLLSLLETHNGSVEATVIALLEM